MEHGQYTEHLVFRFEDDAGNELLHIAHQVPVGQHGSLRAAGGAGGVDKGTHVVFRKVFRKGRRFVRLSFLGPVIQIMDVDGRAGYVQGRIGDEEDRSCIFQDIVHFPVHQGIIDGDNNGTKAHGGQVGVDKFCPVGRVQGYPVSFTDPHLMQFIPVETDRFRQFSIGHLCFSFEGQMGRIRTFYHFM